MPPAPKSHAETTRATRIVGFRAPVLRDGEIALPVLTASGEWAELVASPALWSQVSEALGLPVAPAPVGPRRRGRCAAPGAHDHYRAILSEWKAGTGTQAELCAAHGIPLSSFSSWLRDQKAARRPITKPNGNRF
jgi:hypothetical protein